MDQATTSQVPETADQRSKTERWRDVYSPNEIETHWVIAAFLIQHVDQFQDWLKDHSPKHQYPCMSWVDQQRTTLSDAARIVALSDLADSGEIARLDAIRKELDRLHRIELFGEDVKKDRERPV